MEIMVQVQSRVEMGSRGSRRLALTFRRGGVGGLLVCGRDCTVLVLAVCVVWCCVILCARFWLMSSVVNCFLFAAVSCCCSVVLCCSGMHCVASACLCCCFGCVPHVNVRWAVRCFNFCRLKLFLLHKPARMRPLTEGISALAPLVIKTKGSTNIQSARPRSRVNGTRCACSRAEFCWCRER